MNMAPQPNPPPNAIAAELQTLQRRRAVQMKFRIMLTNRLTAIVAGTIGYSNNLTEKERRKLFSEAAKVIKAIVASEKESEVSDTVCTAMVGIDAFRKNEKRIEKAMIKVAELLPVASWVDERDQHGFGILSLATVIGEAGDLSNYSGPAKLWKRFGLAPFSNGERNLMGATWKSGREGKLSAEQWETFGYSPRRRSIAFVIGENLIKQNKGPYRQRYDAAKAGIAAQHPDYKPLRCHRHGMLLATKLLLKRLWQEWNR